jgi:small subunit ribosomal protein S16
MATRIRLQRHGKKSAPFYHIVVADGRAPRDGKFIEKLGTYNPTTNPATIELNIDSAFNWVMTGAQPSETCEAILKYKGVMLKKHLAVGVKKGALTQDQADAKFAKWISEKDSKIAGKVSNLSTAQIAANKARMAAEKASNEAKAKAIAAKAEAAVATEAPAEESAAEETPSAEA